MTPAVIDTEEWREAPGFPLYQVSSEGRVRRHPDHPSHLMRDELARSPTSHGYSCVRLMRDKRAHWLTVHRLVCEAFHGPAPSEKHEVAHNDSDRSNNRASNLRWATRIGNFADKRTAGTHREGEAVPWAKLTERDVRTIRRLIAEGVSVTAIARAYEVSNGAIDGIKSGRNWAHVA